MRKPIMKLLVIAGISFVLFGIHECTKSLPELLRCSSTLFYRHDYFSRRARVMISYNVDEYIDIKGERSSSMIEDLTRGGMTIHYNQVLPERIRPQKFYVYDMGPQTCESQPIGDWQFRRLRTLAINMRSEPSHLKREHIDVPFGPSLLLYAIQENIVSFLYVGSTYCKARLSQMHVYSYEMLYIEDTSRKRSWLNIMVHVPSKVNSKHEPKLHDSLEEYLKDTSAGVASVAYLGACIMNAEIEDYIPDIELKKGGDLDPSKLDEDNFCPQEKLLVGVRFNIVSEHHPGTLMGSSLAQMGTNHDFHREPFMRPIGIGCRRRAANQDDFQMEKQLKDFIINRNQFSTQYATSVSKGVSFIAYDRLSNLLRLDRAGRKNIFDLVARKSYHIGEFSSSGDANSDIEKCVVLDLDQHQPQDEREQWAPKQPHDPLITQEDDDTGSILKRLIGISHQGIEAHHLGMRVIDHVAYEVFESEVKRLDSGEFDVPIVLRSDRPIGKDPSLRLFVTFYVRFEPTSPYSTERSIGLPKYIELWAFNTIRRRKMLKSRLKFIDFNWTLDVEPDNDGESQRSTSMSLFNIEPCYQSRASQAELVIDYERDHIQKASATYMLDLVQQLALLQAHQQLLLEHLAHTLTSKLDISRLNIADMRLKILPKGDLITSMRIAELRSGMLEMTRLGWLSMLESVDWVTYEIETHSGSYSLRDCQLHSIASSKRNWFAHCPSSWLCFILVPDEQVKESFLKPAKTADDLVGKDICTVYSLKYSTVDKIPESITAISQVDMNKWRVTGEHLKISLGYWKEEKYHLFKYEARLTLRKFELLDLIGARLKNDMAVLRSLRHTTIDEDAAGINANQRVSLANSNMDPFRHCQLACQMDEHCASFSICLAPRSTTAVTDNTKKATAGASQCILSSLRLTSGRIRSLFEGKGNKENKDRIQLQVTNDRESQSFVMVREDGCSLHPRDFLVSYQQIKETHINQAGSTSTPSESAYRTDEAKTDTSRTSPMPVSLEDCAGMSFEKHAYDEPKNNNFIYCPMESLCLLEGDTNKLRLPNRQQCFVYAKSSKTVYETHHETAMKIGPKTPEAHSGVVAPGNTETVYVENHLLGLDEESCARECNLHKNNCLAFDMCRILSHNACFLFSIRSPVNRRSAYFPLTNLERKAEKLFNVNLEKSYDKLFQCVHYALKPGYFEVRLRQMLDKEQAELAVATGTATKQVPANEILNQIEELAMNSDREKSRLEVAEIEDEVVRVKEERNKEKHEDIPTHSNIHFLFVLSGLLIGGMGAIFKGELAYAISLGGSQLSQISDVFASRRRREEDSSGLVSNHQSSSHELEGPFVQ